MSKPGAPTACRRQAIRLVAAAALLVLCQRVALAQSDENAVAVAFVRQAGNELVALTNGVTVTSTDRTRLQAFIDRVADVDGVARFCLGRFWATASDEQRRKYLAVFHRVLMANVSSWLGTHREGSAHVTIERPLVAGSDIDVPTIVERAGDPPARITWVVTRGTGAPKITDLVVEGVSMRLTVRNDYASFIVHNSGSIEALIQALQKQADAG
jgi:phospholipid transport system substrate-binding protein